MGRATDRAMDRAMDGAMGINRRGTRPGRGNKRIPNSSLGRDGVG